MPRAAAVPPAGIVRMATPEANLGRWWDCNNVRFRQGMAQPIGGNVAQPNSGVPDPIRDIVSWHDDDYVHWVAYGTDAKLYAYRYDLQTQYDITPAGVGPLDPPGARVGYGLADYGENTYGTARDPADIGPQDISATMGDIWSMDTFGKLLLVVPTQDGRLFVWDPATPATPAVVVPEAPIDNKGVVVTDQRSVVLLGAGGNPRNIAWSDQEDIHMWTPDVTNLAGSQELQTQAYVLTAMRVSDGTLIWTSNDVHKMRYVGPPYAYGIAQIASGCAPISARAPVAIGSFVAWPGLQSFWGYSGNVQALPCDVGDWFFSLINRQMVGRIFGSPNPTFSELWWDWPDEGALECNRYIALNYSDQPRTWIIGTRTRTAADQAGTMDYPILGGPLGSAHSLYLHEYGMTDNGTPRAANGMIYLESGNITLGEGDKRYHVKQVILDSWSNGPLGRGSEPVFGYRFFVREQPHDVEGEWNTGVYTVGHDGLLDVRFSGRSVRMRLEARTDEAFAVGKPRLEIRPGGRR